MASKQTGATYDVLENPYIPVSQLIMDNVVLKLFYCEYSKIIDYLCLHVADLLELSLSPENISVGSRAFEYLEKGPLCLLSKLVEKNRLQRAACDVLSKENPSPVVLSRLATLTLVIAQAFPNSFDILCGYVFQLLSYSNYTGVFNLFEAICSREVFFETAHPLLCNIGFGMIIKQEILRAKIESDPYKDNNAQVIRHLFALIRLCIEQPSLKPCVVSMETVDLLNSNQDSYPECVEDMRWLVIVGILDENTKKMMSLFVPRALSVMNAPYEHASRMRVHSISFITKYLELEPSIGDFLVKEQIHQLILRLLFQFPNHSIMQSALSKLILQGVSNTHTRSIFIEEIIPPLLDETSSLTVSAFRSNCYEILTECITRTVQDADLGAALQSVPGLVTFSRGTLTNRLLLLESDYGYDKPPT